jgi:putative membrane protein insertion efficiency factor
MATRALLLMIEAYRLMLSPLFAGACRFEPSCSRYASEAIGRHGAARGARLALKRLLRCHPWTPGGLDPVP